jgi:hypothetical protein
MENPNWPIFEIDDDDNNDCGDFLSDAITLGMG